MQYGGGYMMGGMHGMWWLFWAVLIAVVLLVVWVVLRGQHSGQDGRQRDTPHQMLHKRLANGDVTPAEYEERKALLDRDISGDRNNA